VRQAFRTKGQDFFSCDLKPAEDGSMFHIKADARNAIHEPGWQFIGAHPDCRHVSVSGMHRTTRGLRDPQLTLDAIAFAELLWLAIQKAGRGYIENPVGVLSTRSKLGKATQIIQPNQFGHDASKQTCLWLWNLPPLEPTKQIAPRMINGNPRWANQTDSGQNRLAPSESRSANRARTYPGIASAMAAQWSNL
jgi:hypothetical protein